MAIDKDTAVTNTTTMRLISDDQIIERDTILCNLCVQCYHHYCLGIMEQIMILNLTKIIDTTHKMHGIVEIVSGTTEQWRELLFYFFTTSENVAPVVCTVCIKQDVRALCQQDFHDHFRPHFHLRYYLEIY